MASFKQYREQLAADKAKFAEEEVEIPLKQKQDLKRLEQQGQRWKDLKENRLVSPESMVDAINFKLQQFVDLGHITPQEKDQLRHYYGIIKIAEKYGSNMAYVLGQLNEVSLLPQAGYDAGGGQENTYQRKIDKLNNEEALKDFDSGNYKALSDSTTVEEMREIINRTFTPPSTELSFDQQKIYTEEEIYKKSGGGDSVNRQVFDMLEKDKGMWEDK
tara:strand:+ start:1125 stop:1775 length:651 start_codon:yes stop_codon:yes gene_type:complete